MGVLILVGTVSISFAFDASLQPVPVYYPGNNVGNSMDPTLKSLVAGLESSGNIEGIGTFGYVTVTVSNASSFGTSFSLNWSSTKPVKYVWIKAGNGGYLYSVNSATSGTDYRSTLKVEPLADPVSRGHLLETSNNANLYHCFSHVTFYFCHTQETTTEATTTEATTDRKSVV